MQLQRLCGAGAGEWWHRFRGACLRPPVSSQGPLTVFTDRVRQASDCGQQLSQHISLCLQLCGTNCISRGGVNHQVSNLSL